MSGLASGINWTNIINDMAAGESAPITQMQAQQTTINSKKTAYQTIGTDLTNLQSDLTKLSSASFFHSTTVSSSNSGVATATTTSGTPVGAYTFAVSQLATSAAQNGSAVSAQSINSTTDVSNLVLGAAALADPISGGTFTVNGKIITIATSDTMQSVFDQISTATGGAVTGGYDPGKDEITLSSSSPIVLGSSADTSNFLQATQLFTNGSGAVSSLNALAGINLNAAASQSNLSGGIVDDGNGQGAFEINGVTINFDASSDSINDILQSINTSEAGVTASYDGPNQHFVLTNNNTGNMGMTMQDVSGNFLAATGLSSGTAQAGVNLKYSINGGATMTSASNTINASSEGLAGLSVTAQSTGSTSIAVNSDTSTIATAITNLVNDYNTIQNYITSQTTSTSSTSSTTGATTSTPGVLTGDMDAEDIATSLRHLINSSPLSGVIQNLNSLGISSNGHDNTLTANTAVLNAALADNLGQVTQLFTKPTTGLAAMLGGFLSSTLGNSGVVSNKEKSFTSQNTAIGTSITNLQTKITNDEAVMQSQFVAMEDAINSINVDKQYLTAYFNSPTTSNSAPTAASSS